MMSSSAPTGHVPGTAGITDEELRRYYALNRAVYPWLSRCYDLITRPLRRLRTQVVADAGAPPGSRVLDVATGTGAQALAFAPSAAEVVGVDISDAMLRVARSRPRPSNVQFVEGDATELAFPTGYFDVGCISFALHEMPAAVRDRVLRELARVTRPGGTVVVVDYGLPASRVGRALASRLVGLYERPYYQEFVCSDLPAQLTAAGVAIRSDRRALRGNVRIVVGHRVV